MNRKTDNDQLLDDVLTESSTSSFRAALLGETLRLARHRRRWRLVRQASGVLAVVGLAVLFAWQHQPQTKFVAQPLVKAPVTRIYQLVETQPLQANAMVVTGQFYGVRLVSSAATVMEVATTAGGFHLINDEQLLALISPRPAILIRTGPNSEELVFADPEDQKRLLGN
jgi:hypothetical protein